VQFECVVQVLRADESAREAPQFRSCMAEGNTSLPLRSKPSASPRRASPGAGEPGAMSRASAGWRALSTYLPPYPTPDQYGIITPLQ
jgi:hypothetical protein